jgi:PAS domain S-box-containing protein
MNKLLSGFEQIHYGFKTSLSIVDNDKKIIHRLSAPSMPELCAIIEGAEIQTGDSPCIKAVRNSSEVYIQDVINENISTDYRQILDKYRIRSSRSIPVINTNNKVLAVVTIFNTGHKNALIEETSLIKRLGTILQLLIENNAAKKEAEQSNERFQLIMQATSDSVWDFNLTSKQVYRGSGFDNYYNQEPGLELINAKKWENNVHPEDLDRVEKSLEASLRDPSAKKWIEDYRYLKKDGTYAWVIDKGLIIRDRDNHAIRVVGALQDISELKKNQESLIQSQENYKNMFSNNPTPLWTYDMESKRFSMVNDAALKLYGYTRAEFLKLNLFSIRIEEEHEKLRKYLESKAFLEDLNVEYEWTHLKKDGTEMIVDVVSHPMLINGRRSRLVAIKDITDKKKDRQEILAQNQRLREIAQISSHETRKPLASILGLVTLFDKENLANPLNKEIVQYLDVTAHELDTVIHNIVKKTWLESEASSSFRP